MSQPNPATPDTTAAAPAVQPRQPRARRGRAPADEPEYIDYLHKDDDVDDAEIIMLNDNDEIPPSGQYFAVNGRYFILKPNVWYRVPGFLLAVINHAITDRPVQNDQLQLVGVRPQKRFPFETYRG